jgi:hypothetical protein
MKGAMMLGRLSFAVAVLVLAGCASRTHDPPVKATLHLVIDAGSTGTRFCLYEIERTAGGACRAPAPPSAVAECRPVSAPNGLADLDLESAIGVVDAGLNALGRETSSRVAQAALLGTGGFRRQPPQEQARILMELRARFADRIAYIDVISGEMEGVLAWRSAEQRGTVAPFATLEIGGATVQYAAGTSAASVQAVSAPIGLTAARTALTRARRYEACRIDDEGGSSYAACRAALVAAVFGDPGLGELASLVPAQARARLVGLGAPWGQAAKIAGQTRLTHAGLRREAETICPMPLAQARQRVGEHWSPPLACLLFTYAASLLEAVGADKIEVSGESWPRGAAVSPEVFSACRQ